MGMFGGKGGKGSGGKGGGKGGLSAKEMAEMENMWKYLDNLHETSPEARTVDPSRRFFPRSDLISFTQEYQKFISGQMQEGAKEMKTWQVSNHWTGL